MARRRRFGSGLQQASAANAQFLEILLRAQQAKKAREEEDRLQRERAQMEHALTTQRIREQGEQSVLTQIAQNPKFASLLVRAGRPKMGDLDLTKLQPTGEELAGPLFEDIGNATTPEAIPTGTELLGRFRGEGGAEDPHFKGPFPTVMGKEQVALPTAEVNTPIAQLMRARQAKEAQVMGEIQRKVKEQPRYSATGPFAGAQIAGPDFDPTQITATPGQLGADKATELVTGEFSPQVTRAKSNQQGSVSYASSAGSTRGQMDVEYANLDKLAKIAGARSVNTGQLGAAEREKLAGTQAALNSLGKLEELFTKGVKDVIGPLGGRWESLKNAFPGVDPSVVFASFEAEETTLKNNTIKALTGAQMSEPEAKRIMGQVPTKTDKPTVWLAKARAMRSNHEYLAQRILDLSAGRTPQPWRDPMVDGVRLVPGPDGRLVPQGGGR